MKANYIRAILLTAMLSVTAAAHSQQWTLDQCIEYAISHNIDIRKKDVQIQQRKVLLNTSRNEWLPEVEGQIAEQFSFGNYNSTTGSMRGDTSVPTASVLRLPLPTSTKPVRTSASR